ncbi:hypothetical protein NPS01_02850 [Nocardioides psychrotolerans]|nr:hypothetical protein NPS01_02850 [Nocardioides psychrotolerans]
MSWQQEDVVVRQAQSGELVREFHHRSVEVSGLTWPHRPTGDIDTVRVDHARAQVTLRVFTAPGGQLPDFYDR